MILTEWNTEDAIAFAREEGREDGFAEGKEDGLAEGKEDGLAEGRLEGREHGLVEGKLEGRNERQYEIARNLLAEDMQPEFIQKVTGLSQDEIEKL